MFKESWSRQSSVYQCRAWRTVPWLKSSHWKNQTTQDTNLVLCSPECSGKLMLTVFSPHWWILEVPNMLSKQHLWHRDMVDIEENKTYLFVEERMTHLCCGCAAIHWCVSIAVSEVHQQKLWCFYSLTKWISMWGTPSFIHSVNFFSAVNVRMKSYGPHSAVILSTLAGLLCDCDHFVNSFIAPNAFLSKRQ